MPIHIPIPENVNNSKTPERCYDSDCSDVEKDYFTDVASDVAKSPGSPLIDNFFVEKEGSPVSVSPLDVYTLTPAKAFYVNTPQADVVQFLPPPLPSKSSSMFSSMFCDKNEDIIENCLITFEKLSKTVGKSIQDVMPMVVVVILVIMLGNGGMRPAEGSGPPIVMGENISDIGYYSSRCGDMGSDDTAGMATGIDLAVTSGATTSIISRISVVGQSVTSAQFGFIFNAAIVVREIISSGWKSIFTRFISAAKALHNVLSMPTRILQPTVLPYKLPLQIIKKNGSKIVALIKTIR